MKKGNVLFVEKNINTAPPVQKTQKSRLGIFYAAVKHVTK